MTPISFEDFVTLVVRNEFLQRRFTAAQVAARIDSLYAGLDPELLHLTVADVLDTLTADDGGRLLYHTVTEPRVWFHRDDATMNERYAFASSLTDQGDEMKADAAHIRRPKLRVV